MDPDSAAILIIIQVILIALNAVFASAEIAILSVNEMKLAKLASEGNKKAKRLLKLTSEPSKFLSTIQVAITLAGFLGSAFAADHFSEPIVQWLLGLGIDSSYESTLDTVAVIFITLVLSYFTLVFGELVPKRVAMKKAEKLALALSGLIATMSSLFKPVVWFLTISNNAVLRLLGIDPNEEDEQASEEEIKLMVDAGAESGTIDHDEKELIKNVFEFDDLTAAEIATHRTDVALLWMEESMEEWDQIIHKFRHTLYPVCEDSADNIVGILNAKDYFRLDEQTREAVMEEAVRPAYFVPENIKADVLFRNMKKSGNPLAVVLDEYGGMVGIVTINDLVECIVGDLGEDEADNTGDDPKMKKTGEDTWDIIGNIELDDIEDETGISLERGEFDTFTGLVFGTLGIIPDEGEQDINLETKHLKIHVKRVEDHQISEATIQLITPEEEDSETEAE